MRAKARQSECECPCCGRPVEKPLHVDLILNRLHAGGASVQLTPKQAELAHLLVKASPNAIGIEQLIFGLYGHADDSTDDPKRTIRVFVYHLRTKLAALGVVIETGWGRGYRLLST